MRYNELGFNIFNTDKKNQLLKDVVLSRMVYCQSKLKLCKTMSDKFDKSYKEDQIYRAMDELYPKIDKIKYMIFSKTYALMPNINVLLFDVTTLYCESIIQDGTREFGFSKDGKFNNTQLVLALATNELGLPIGYELFPGNCAEVNTLLIAINKWSKLFNIKDTCFIGDRAMFSEDNIRLIEEHGYTYIIAAKLRSTSTEMQQCILDESRYKDFMFGEEKGRIAEFVYKFEPKSTKLIINKSEIGYVATVENKIITEIKYIAPVVANNIIVTKDIINKVQDRLKKLRIYTSRCKCRVMTDEEYKLLDKSNDEYKNVSIITENEIHFNNQTVNLERLSEKQRQRIITTAKNNKIANSVMIKLFKEHYVYESYVNIPSDLMRILFPNKHKQENRRLCVSYKPSRASNDIKKRERILAKLRFKQGSINKILKTPAKMYMTTEGNSKLDTIKIIAAERWDGVHGVITNITASQPQDILARYSNLWRIEEAFRINKHNLKMRPIYHYKKERIYSHIVMCYMAFTILKLIQYQTQLVQPRFTINNITETLLSVESSIYIDLTTKIRYKMPGVMSAEAMALYRAFGVNNMRKVTQYN